MRKILTKQDMKEIAGEDISQCPSCGRWNRNHRKVCKGCGVHLHPQKDDVELVKEKFEYFFEGGLL